MKQNNTIAETTPSYLVNLPMEIHFHIRDHLLRDPYTHISQLRTLRLVCQLFDIIWSPVVFNDILLFSRSQTHHDRVKYLRSLVRGKALSCTTLTLQNWDCIDTDIDWFLSDMKFTWQVGAAREDMGLRLKVPFLILASPATCLVKFLLGPRKCFTKALDCIRSRFYASLLPRKAQFAHIRCVKMTVTEIQSRWAVYRSTRIFSALPQLTELDLNINPGVNWEHIAQCLNHVTSLRTFRLIIRPYKDRVLMTGPRNLRISRLRYFIARNPYLTRLVLIAVLGCGYGDLSELFLDIPSNKPLKLDHISIHGWTNYQALIPHLQALSSFEFWGAYEVVFLADLMKANIFPPTITVEYLDLVSSFLFVYLRSHPGIISLSFLRLAYYSSDVINDRLSSILVQHSKTLRSLKMPSLVLADVLRVSSTEMSFLRCTNLREIVLIKDYPEEGTNVDIRCEKQVFPIIARLDPLLTVGFTGILAFRASIDYCRTSDNPLVRDLAGRLFFLEE